MSNLISVVNTEFSNWNYIVVIIYMLASISFGIFFCKKEENTEEYFLGGRKMPVFAIAISMFVTLFSAITFVAVPGEAFQYGLSMCIGVFLSPIGTIIAFSLFVKFYFTKGAFTPFSYLERRFDDNIRLLISVIFILMRLFYLGVVMYASAKYLKGVIGWEVWQSILVIGLIGIFYTALGGVKAVIWTDFMQFFVLIAGLGVVFYKIATSVDGGLPGAMQFAFDNNRGFEILKDMNRFMSLSVFERVTIWGIIVGMISSNTFTYGCDQMTIQRLLCTSSYKEAKKATLINVLISFPVVMIFWVIGLGLFSFYNSTDKILPSGISADEVMSYFVMTELPVPIPGLLISALMAAVMSTIDSGMNSLSAVFVKDVYLTRINPKATERQEMRVSKIATVVWGVVFVGLGIIIGSLSENITSSILEVAGIWGALLGIAAGTFLLGVTTTKAHKGIIYLSSLIAIIVLCGLALNYYTADDVSKRVTFGVVGLSPFIVMLLVGYPLCLLWPAKEGVKSVDGLTLWTYKR